MAHRILRRTWYLRVVQNPGFTKTSRKLCSNLSTVSSSIEKEGYLKKKLNQLVEWYEETTGMDEVRIAQKRVLQAEDNFINAQNRRREANKKVAIVQNQLKDVYGELDNTTRGEERYVALITEEHKLIKLERQVTEEFKQSEREEREYFSALSSAVKESHEKERAQAERTKYWSIIGSIIGTVIGVVGSSINNNIKMKELRKLIIASNGSVGTTGSLEVFENHKKELTALAIEMNTSLKKNCETIDQLKYLISALEKPKSNANSKAEKNLNMLYQQQVILEKNLEEMKASLENRAVSDVEVLNQDNHASVKMVLLGSVLLACPIVFQYFDLFR